MFNLFKNSFMELEKIKTIVICGFLLALSLVLNTQSIQISSFILKFSFISSSIAGFLFGPVVGCLLAGVTDILTSLLFPKGPYSFPFTFSAIVGGMIYGLLLYRKGYGTKNLALRVVICRILVSVIVNLILNTLFSAMYSGKGFFVLLPARISKEIITIPIYSIIMYIVLKAINRVYYQLNLNNNQDIKN